MRTLISRGVCSATPSSPNSQSPFGPLAFYSRSLSGAITPRADTSSNMGARRHRAARLAGLDAIPVIVQDAAEPDRYAQMVENIQRDDLAATEIATFIAARLGAGDKQAEIARKLGKPKDWVSRYAAIPRMPDFLQAKLHSSSIRAVYELYQAWRERPELVERACASQDSFTDAQARRVARQLGASSSTPADRAGGDDIRAVPRSIGEAPKPQKSAPM